MLIELELRTFKCFRRHNIPFRPTSIIVGRNNAGKSTIAEALRLVSIILGRFEYLPFKNVPGWLDAPKVELGVSPSLQNQEFNFASVFHSYSDPPAEIVARFTGGSSMKIYIGGENRVHAVIRDGRRTVVSTKAHAKRLRLPEIDILPQIAPLKSNEQILQPDYVRQNLSSTLAPLHFRNQLNLLYDRSFREFKQISESTWPRLQVQELLGRGRRPGSDLELMLRNDDFVGEVRLMGHGLQMWLQIMWFLARCRGSSTVILDEPDIYMHADVQRKLIRLLRGRHSQVIVATHSVEIMSEVMADEILVVDRDRRQATFTTDVPAVQQVIDQIGGVHNLQLARLWHARRCLFVEGKDLVLLKRFQDILFPNSEQPIEAIPNMSIGGWSGWPYAVGSAMLVETNVRQDVLTYCILDSDFHTPQQIQQRKDEAVTKGINLHIWNVKEIENYLVVPRIVRELIVERADPAKRVPGLSEIEERIFEIAGQMRNDVLDAYSSEFYSQNRAAGIAAAMSAARGLVDERWDQVTTRLAIVSGKRVLAKLSEWAQTEYGVSLSAMRIAQRMVVLDLPNELVRVITAIENNEPF